MSSVADQMWSRLTAIIASRQSTATRLAEEEAAWGVAKETLNERQEDFNTAQDEAAETFKDSLPEDEWRKLRSKHDDLMRARETFELTDRAKRRDEKFIKDQERRLIELCVETFGDPAKLNFAEVTGAKKSDRAAWEAVMLADLLGDMFAPHYTPHGLITVRQAKDALEGTLVKQAVIDEKLSKEHADFLKNEVIRFLDSRSIEHKLGKGKKTTAVPEPAKPTKAGAPVPAGDPAAFENGGEINPKEWGAFQDYCAATAIASSKPVEKLVKVGDRTFACVAIGDDYAVGAHAIPRKEFEKPGKKNVIRTEPDVEDGPDKYAGVIIAGPRGEYVLQRSYRFTPPAE